MSQAGLSIKTSDAPIFLPVLTSCTHSLYIHGLFPTLFIYCLECYFASENFLTLESGLHVIENNGTLDFIQKELKIVHFAGCFNSIECQFINRDVTNTFSVRKFQHVFIIAKV